MYIVAQYIIYVTLMKAPYELGKYIFYNRKSTIEI